MLHEHKPIRKDHEICCSSCGIILELIPETIEMPISNFGGELVYPGLDKMMLGLGLERSMNWKSQTNESIRDYQNLLNNFKKLCNAENLPEYVAYETIKRLLKKKRGLYSYRLQIKELIDVLQDDNRLVFKVRTIKLKYENATPV